MARSTIVFFLVVFSLRVSAGDEPWYEQGNFQPVQRLEFTISNDLDFDRHNAPVVIRREDFPLPDQHEMWVTVVDPALPPYAGPSEELLRVQGGHQLRAEVNGHAVFHQMDDLDKDGIWDELFFQTDIKANSEKTIYVYLGQNMRGWNKHYTHANIGSYTRHIMPFWESENVGWKIWFANSVDVYAKRKPVLMSNQLYMENLDGYGVSAINPDWGSDIQGVAGSFGGGAICLFEDPQQPDAVSMPRFTPTQRDLPFRSNWNAGQLSDTRYAYDVVVNGPVRSIIRIRGMNWNSGKGFYEYDQTYTVYAKQSYTTSRVRFTTFAPEVVGVQPGVGIRKKPEEKLLVVDDGLVISGGPEEIRDPNTADDREAQRVDFIGTAVVVREKYEPEYQFVASRSGNHTFRLTPTEDNVFEYLLSSAWSEGAVYNNADDFVDYIRQTQLEYENPLVVEFEEIQEKTD